MTLRYVHNYILDTLQCRYPASMCMKGITLSVNVRKNITICLLVAWTIIYFWLEEGINT